MFRSSRSFGVVPDGEPGAAEARWLPGALADVRPHGDGRAACPRLGSGRRVCRQPAQRGDPVRVLGVSAAREERRSRLRRRPLSPRDGALERRDEHRLPTRTPQPADVGARWPWTQPDGGSLLQPRVPRLVAPRLVLDPRDAPRLLASVCGPTVSGVASLPMIWPCGCTSMPSTAWISSTSSSHRQTSAMVLRRPKPKLVERLARSKREDLLKMHAYRDAIRRSAGAYVLYPGDEQRTPFMEHHEVLPGLGAFPLRPGATGPVGTAALDRFLAEVIDHVADRATQHERSRFWRTVIHRTVPMRSDKDRRLPALSVPPSDAPVMCGYLRGGAHRRWVDHNGLYNVRAGDRRGAVAADADILRALDIVLYGPGLRPSLWARAGAWFVQSQDEMLTLGYPNPRGKVYLCCPVERRADEPEWLGHLRLLDRAATRATPGAPFASTWRDLLDEVLRAER